MSSLPFHLGLRDFRHMVGLIRRDGGERVHIELGVPYSSDLDRRACILEQWGMHDTSPRLDMTGATFQPLPRRYQVALAVQTNPILQQILQGGIESEPLGRREIASGIKARLHLGVGRTPLANGQPPMHHGRQ